MKKILSLALMLLGGIAMLTSCESDNDSNPTIKSPTKFTINTSPVADQYIQLAQDNNVNLTWSQPNYGYNAFATYQIQVGLVKDGQVTWYEKDGQPKYLATTYTVCNANISGEEISEVLCAIDGFKYAEDYVPQGFREVALRVYASINNSMKAEVAGTGILSENYVTFKHMAAYNAIKSPGYIYLVGNCTDWNTPNAGNADFYSAWRLFEKDDAIGSKVYYGTFDLPAGDLQFRFCQVGQIVVVILLEMPVAHYHALSRRKMIIIVLIADNTSEHSVAHTQTVQIHIRNIDCHLIGIHDTDDLH